MKNNGVSIGVMAKEFDLTTRTIRFYEELGLLKPHRLGTRRIYDKGEEVRLKLILRGRRLNFSFDEIREVLDLYSSIGKGKEQQIRRLLEILKEKTVDMDIHEKEIHAMRVEINNVQKMCLEALKKNKRGGNGC